MAMYRGNGSDLKMKKGALISGTFIIACSVLSSAASGMASKPDSSKAGDRSREAVIAAANRDFQAMDGNRDGVVTRAEVDAHIVRQNPGINPDNRQKLGDLVLSRFDLDRNGTISRAEVIRVSLAQGG